MLAWVVVVVNVVALAAGASRARADAEDDVKDAFVGFVDDVAAGAPLPAGLELFVTPITDEVPLPGDLTGLKALVPASKAIKWVSLVRSPGGRSAWLAAEIGPVGPSARAKKPPAVIRATAVLALDGATWKLRAAHWSIGVKNVKPGACGALAFEWNLDPAVPPVLAPAVALVLEALDSGKPAAFGRLLSDDKKAEVFGSAPKETFVGGAKIKGVFKKWSVSLPYWDRDDPALPARAGATADGELMWMAVGVAYFRLCTSYRTMFVMAREKGAWRIVHQHYSEPVGIAD
jgi:hypothetical protein